MGDSLEGTRRLPDEWLQDSAQKERWLCERLFWSERSPRRVKSSNLALNCLFSSVLILHLPPALSAPRRLESPKACLMDEENGGLSEVKWQSVIEWRGHEWASFPQSVGFGFFFTDPSGKNWDVWKRYCVFKNALRRRLDEQIRRETTGVPIAAHH